MPMKAEPLELTKIIIKKLQKTVHRPAGLEARTPPIKVENGNIISKYCISQQPLERLHNLVKDRSNMLVLLQNFC